jgi:hypothetical protein
MALNFFPSQVAIHFCSTKSVVSIHTVYYPQSSSSVLALASTAITGFVPHQDHTFALSKTTYVILNGISSSMRGGAGLSVDYSDTVPSNLATGYMQLNSD